MNSKIIHNKLLVFLTFVLLGFSLQSNAQTMMPIPAHSTTYSGSVRGYWFIAPVSFTMTGLKVAAEAGPGTQSIQVMKIHSGGVALYATMGTNFTTLFYVNNAPNNTVQAVSIPVNAGDTIGILGQVGTTLSYTASAANFPSTIGGAPVTLTRFIYQGNINAAQALEYSSEATGNLGRVEMYYTTAPCVGQPSAGTIPATMAVCPNTPFSIPATGATSAGSMANQWQSRNPAGTGTWTNIVGATMSTYSSPGITTPTDFRYISKCTPSGLSDTTTVMTTTINAPNTCYCIPSNSSSSSYYISDFSTTGGITNITNNSTGFSPTGYGNYTATDTVSALTGNSVNISATSMLTSSYGYDVWVDWNQDGNFNGANEHVLTTGGSLVTGVYTGTITVPATALLGSTRMRIRNAYISAPAPVCGPHDWGEAEDYIFTVIPLQNCTAVTLPTSMTIAADNDTVCVVQDVKLTLTSTLPPVSGLTYQYQSAPSATGPWTNIGTPQVSSTLLIPNVGTAVFYRLRVLCGGTIVAATTSNVLSILITNPQVLSVQDSFHCGPGSVTLGAVGAINTSLKWYENATGGLALGTGSNFATPYLLQTDTFYVASGVGGGSTTPTFIGTGTASTTGNPSPYYNLYDGNRNQYLITAAELQAAGFSAGIITELGLDVLGTGSVPLLNWTIKMGATSLTTLSNIGWETGLTQVYTTPSLTTTANTVNVYTFATPYPWDGVSNIIIETCYYNGTWGGTYATVKYTTGLSFNASHYLNQDGNASICTQTSTTSVGSVATSRPNFRFSMVTGCESPRQPVIAHIRPVPTVNLGNDFNVCVDAGANFTLDAGTFANSPTYLWDNNSTSQTRGVNTTGSYSVAVTNSYGCTGRDTVNVTLRNNPLVDLGGDTTVCEGIILTLDAGNDGISYFWNTGENTNSIDIDHSGTYTVIVTNSVGCTKTDTVTVLMSGHIPTIDGISVNNLGPKTFKFQPINPQNAVLYDWDFGDGSAHSPMINPTHTFPNATNYLVKLKIKGTCGQVLDSTNIYIVGLDDVSTAKTELFIYPNPTTGKAKIVNKGNLRMEHVEVFNVLGQKVYSHKADSAKEHEISLLGIASGIYTVQILTEEGTVTQKLEIVR